MLLIVKDVIGCKEYFAMDWGGACLYTSIVFPTLAHELALYFEAFASLQIKLKKTNDTLCS